VEDIRKRTKRHLDQLEVTNQRNVLFSVPLFDYHKRTNYAEPSISYFDEEQEEEGGKYAKGKARQTISDKRNVLGGRKKKSSMNVRTALLYKKNLATLIEESVRAPVPFLSL
jgi:zinc finger HIT domain-containing protein 1